MLRCNDNYIFNLSFILRKLTLLKNQKLNHILTTSLQVMRVYTQKFLLMVSKGLQNQFAAVVLNKYRK